MKYDKGLLTLLKEHQSANIEAGYNSHVNFYKVGYCINLLVSSKSAWVFEQINQASKKINKFFLKGATKHKKLIIISIFGICITATNATSHAKDFGTKGHTYQIAEQAFLDMIDQRLRKVDMQKEQKKMTALVKERVSNPAPVKNVIPAVKNRTFYFDPTYILDQDAVLPCGKILHKAGIKVNPLEHMQLNRKMIFVDTREVAQIEWLNQQILDPITSDAAEIEDRIILVGGSPFKLKNTLGKEHEHKVYFDQGGELTTRFGIKASPAVVVQDGLKLRIEEIKL